MIRIGDDLVLWTLDEVSAALNLPRVRVEALVRNDQLAGVMHGGRWMVAPEEVERFRADWVPPVRATTAGKKRRFVPPPRPAEMIGKG